MRKVGLDMNRSYSSSVTVGMCTLAVIESADARMEPIGAE